jgi:hypothetical protein
MQSGAFQGLSEEFSLLTTLYPIDYQLCDLGGLCCYPECSASGKILGARIRNNAIHTHIDTITVHQGHAQSVLELLI